MRYKQQQSTRDDIKLRRKKLMIPSMKNTVNIIEAEHLEGSCAEGSPSTTPFL